MTTLYEKIGRRYKPAAERDEWDAWPKGSHLVVVEPGIRMCRYNVEPDRAAVLAAVGGMRQAICDLVREKLRMRPRRPPVTLAQQAAWCRFQRAMGDDAYCVEYASVQEIADAVADLVAQEAKPCP